MSEENVEIVRRMYEEAKTRPDALYEFLDDDIDWETTELDMAGTAQGRGPDTVRSFFRSWVGAFEDWGYEAEDLIDAGDAVIAQIHQWGRGKASGVMVENSFWQVWTLREGKAVRATHHRKKAEALEAAGLSEADMPDEGLEPPTPGL
jgi:ketosteroid isomerase-like protein